MSTIDKAQFRSEYPRAYNVASRFARNRLAVIGLGITIVYFCVAILGPFIAPHDPGSMDAANRLAAPSLEHPFGTDENGRDVLSRVLVGARYSLYVAVSVVTISSVVGISLGLVAGYFRGWVDELTMRGVDVMLAFPSVLLALLIIAMLGVGLDRAIIALGIAYTPIMLRVTRGSALGIREEEYVLAAIAYGENSLNVMRRVMLPNLVSAVMVQATITFAFSILTEAGLSYLGLSAQPPTPTWGIIVSEGQTYIQHAPWISLFGGLAIMITVLGLTFLGVGLRDAFDPKTDVGADQMGTKP